MIKGLLVTVLVVVAAVAVALYVDYINAFTGQAPRLEKQWWGDGNPRKDDETIKPFKIDFPKQVLDDLSRRLNNTPPFHPPLEGVGFEYGFNTKFLQTVLDFWKTKYSWKERQTYLNSLPQYTTEVQGLKIHYIHAKAKVTKAPVKVVPLLLVHGWPGSVREFYEIIPLLTTQREGQDFVFEVIAPSLPGYGFSQATNRPGLGPSQVSVVLHSLMQRLGHQMYMVQGGDWGALIVTMIAQMFPESVVGLHVNMGFVMPTPGMLVWQFIGSWYPSLIGDEHDQKFIYPMSDHYAFLLEESGYLHLQATKPDTIGVALRESPIGLAAYILEKFSTWTNRSWKTLPDGGLLSKYKMENLLDNVMIYWLTGTITTSMRLYSENFNRAQRSLGFDTAPVIVPSAIARFPQELANQPRSVLKKKFKLLMQVTDMPRGGHFGAFEEPQLLADDIWAFNVALHPKPVPNSKKQ